MVTVSQSRVGRIKEAPMTDCIFCRIINRELPSTVVFENEKVMAIVPLEPVSKGHALVIPKHHSTNVLDIESADLLELAEAVRRLSKRMVEEHKASGINVLHAAGSDAQQTVFHFHWHLVPRYPNDGLDLWFRHNL